MEIMPKLRYKVGDKIKLNLQSGAEDRIGEVTEAKFQISKIKVTYEVNGKTNTLEGWFKNKFLTKIK